MGLSGDVKILSATSNRAAVRSGERSEVRFNEDYALSVRLIERYSKRCVIGAALKLARVKDQMEALLETLRDMAR